MKKTKENAITLVALVITIVILLILAGIAISNLLGEHGLINQAKLGKEKYAISAAKEKLELEITNLQVEQQAKGESLTKEILPKINNDDIDVRDISNFPVEVICGKYKFEVDNNFQVKYIGEADDTVIKYTTEPDNYTNQNSVKVMLKISNPKGIKSIEKPGEESEVVESQTKIETDFTVNKNGHYILKVVDAKDKEVTKDIYIDLIDTLAPEKFTPEIQKNEKSITVIEKGNDAEYEMDIITRYEHGEFFSADSIKQNIKEIYHTSLGRTVYGGGGIMPDIFVPQDTTGMTSYYRMAATRGLIIRYTLDYTDKNRNKLKEYDTPQKMEAYLKTQNLLEKFAEYAEKKGLKRRNILMYKSKQLFEESLYGNIIYNMLGIEAYITYSNLTDKTVQKALEVLEKGESFPQAPEKTSEK